MADGNFPNAQTVDGRQVSRYVPCVADNVQTLFADRGRQIFSRLLKIQFNRSSFARFNFRVDQQRMYALAVVYRVSSSVAYKNNK